MDLDPPANAEANSLPGVTVSYLGHAAFLWQATDETRVLVDPFQDPSEGPAWFERPFPRVSADLAVATHDHFDHNALQLVEGEPAVLAGPGEFETPGIRVSAVPEVHAGKWVMPNQLVLIESGGVRFLHCGDNRFDVAQEVVSKIGNVDVVIVPVDDSYHLMSRTEAWRLATSFSPRVVIPMHYLTPGVVAPSSTLLGIEKWLQSLPADIRVKHLPGHETRIRPVDLPGPGQIEVWVFEEALAVS